MKKKKKRQEALEKNIGCNFIRINPSKENYDADYEIGRIQTCISGFKNKKLTELVEKWKKKKKSLKIKCKPIKNKNSFHRLQKHANLLFRV